MLLINFAHPLTAEQRSAVEYITGLPCAREIHRMAQFDPARRFVEQGLALVNSVGLTTDEWQSESLLINLPGHSAVAAIALAELHGRAGYFPAILRLRPMADTTPPKFEVAEILNLQTLREAARQRR